MKPACEHCPFARDGGPHQQVKALGPTKPLGVLVGEAPSRDDYRDGEPLSPRSPTGREFDELLKEAGLDRSDLLLINAIACVPTEPRDDRQLALAATCCRPLLADRLASLHPDVPVLALGSVAQFALDGKAKSIGRNRGFIDYDWTLTNAVNNPIREAQFNAVVQRKLGAEAAPGVDAGGSEPE
jgi:hypothetical protein